MRCIILCVTIADEHVCPWGSYRSQKTLDCEPCPKGTYATKHKGRHSCAACPSGRTTLREGSTDIRQCGEQGRPDRMPETQLVSVIWWMCPLPHWCIQQLCICGRVCVGGGAPSNRNTQQSIEPVPHLFSLRSVVLGRAKDTESS